jgi:hypothetical protein
MAAITELYDPFTRTEKLVLRGAGLRVVELPGLELKPVFPGCSERQPGCPWLYNRASAL